MNAFAFPMIINASVSLYPNPTTDFFQVIGIEGTALIKISDLKCRVLITRQITGSENVSVSELPKGVYIAKIKTSTGTIEKKLVKN